MAKSHLAGGVGASGESGVSCTADHYLVVVHVDESALRGGPGRSDLPRAPIERLTCDGSIVWVVDDERGGLRLQSRISMSDCCGCDKLEARALNAKERRVLKAVLAINVATFVMMVVGSALSGSSSLLSGTLDNFGDAVTYALSLAVVGSSVVAKARVALVKGLLIGSAAVAVAIRIVWSLANPEVPVVETMGAAALLNLGANAVCLWLLTPYRNGDVNMASAWECSRNDIFEGCAVVVTTVAVWLFDSRWPDLIVATVLLALFTRSAARVVRSAWTQMHGDGLASA